MGEGIVIATGANLKTAILTSGPSAPAAPVANLARREPADCLVLTDLSQAWVQVEFAEPVAPRLLAALYVNATAAATARWRGADSAAAVTAAPAFDTGATAFARGEAGLAHRKGRVHDWEWRPDIPAHTVWRLDIEDAANPDGRLIVGNLVVDNAWQPGGFDWDHVPPTLVDPSRMPRATQGQRQPLNRRPYDVCELPFDFGSREDFIGFARDLDEAVGTTEPVFVALDPDAADYRQREVIFGLMSDLPPVVRRHLAIYARRYRIEELIP